MSELTEKKQPSSLHTRIKSAAVGIPVILFLLWRGGVDFAVLIAAVAGIAVYEWVRMVTSGKTLPPVMVPVCVAAGVASVFIGGLLASPVAAAFVLLATCFMVFAFFVYQGRQDDARKVIPGILYIGFSLSLLLWLRQADAQGGYDVLVLLLIVWGSDTFAYFTGKTLGGPKLAPKISPKKTWSGFVGSSLGAAALAGLMASPFMLALFPAVPGVAPMGGFGVAGYAVIGAVLAMVGQAGDLAISKFKRQYNIKDMGSIIPGHGGVLDRIDALLLVTYAYALLRAVL